VVINSDQQKQLALRSGMVATVIPNVLDFAHAPKVDKTGGRLFRQALGLTSEDKIILQPTRVIRRKGIEHAIELVRALADPSYKLVITHEAGDEGYAYAEWLESHARDNGVDLRLAQVDLEDPWADPESVQREPRHDYTLWDIYDQADLVTYPSLYEGFGNAFLEAVYLRKPILINRYETFIRDIEPLGFKLATMDGFLSKSTVQHVKTILASPALCTDMTAHNYAVATDNFSYGILEERLGTVIRNATGDAAFGKPVPEPRCHNIVYLDSTRENSFIPTLPQQPVDLIYLCFPNNPTGATITHDQLAQWVTYARDNDALILYDAAYEAFIRDASLPRSIYEIEGAREVAIEFRSFSKTAGFTGTRCAFTVVPKTCRAFDQKGHAQSLHPLWNRRHSTKFNGVSYPVQKAAAAVYSEKGQAQVKGLVDYYMANAALIRKEIEAIGFECAGGENSPYIWIDGKKGSWDFFDQLLNEAGVVCTPGAGFGTCGEGYIRISAFNSYENVRKAMDRVKAAIG